MSTQTLECRALLIIDQEPIRQSATKEMQTLYSKMQNLRGKIEEFESKDRPAFTRWLRTEFSDQLKDLADLQDRLGDAEDLANEVQMVRFALGCSYYDAYVNAMERRRKGLSFEESFGTDDESEDNENFDSSESSCGSRSEKKSSEKSTEGESFEMHDSEDDSDDQAADKKSSDQNFWSKIKSSAKSAGQSIKARYRQLARLLHPDLRGSDPWTKELWERTQAAYSEGNDQELEQLLVLAKVATGNSSGDSSVWDLRKGVLFLKKSVRELRSEISVMSQDMAWGFIGLKDRTRLRRKISYDLEYQHDEALVRLENLEAQLARWSVPPARRSRTRPSPGGSRSNWDLEIDF